MIVTRFAPSPTGDLHIGSARTALYSWLWAKKNHGKFILRIEDTDRERSTQAAVDVILEGMQWLELDYDEGPIFQTDRFERYNEIIQQLVDTHHAYRCYCSKERLETLRQSQIENKQKARYDGHCRELTTQPAGPSVVRFKTPQTGSVLINDVIKGQIIIQNKELDDLIIARSDGSPTYNLCVVVDDWDMKVTHVLRGDDHINNTPRQIHIFNALGASVPIYGHMPMLLGSDGKRLSKRHGAVSVLQYRTDGILPQALLNYLVRLGWSRGDQEIFSKDEMINLFDLKNINNAPAAFDLDKLLWLNQYYFKNSDPKLVAKHLLWQLQNQGLTTEQIARGPDLSEVVKAQAQRCKTLVEMAQKSVYFYAPIKEYDEKAVLKELTVEALELLQSLVDIFSAPMLEWTPGNIQDCISKLTDKLGIKLGKIAAPLRVAVTGGSISPPIDITLYLLGKELTIERLEQTIASFKSEVLANNT